MASTTPTELERVLVEAVAREPDSQLIDRPDWVQVRTPSSRLARHNAVLRARIPPADLAAAVARVIEEHDARGAQLRWVVGPSSSPGELAEVVASTGLGALGLTLGMTREVPADDLPLGVPGLTVRAVESEADVDVFAETCMRAFERGTSHRDEVAIGLRRALAGALPTRSWVAWLGGEPVATSHLRFVCGLGYFQGAAVLPAHRGRGIYRALLHHRLAVLRRRGIARAVVWASADGSGIACQKVGFETVCTAEFFESTKPPD